MIINEQLGVEIEIFSAKDLDCLKQLDIAAIDKLFLNIHKPVSLKFLQHLTGLKQLLIAGSLKNLEQIAQCTALQKLSIQGAVIDNLDFIHRLPLKSFGLENIKTRIDKLVIPNIPGLENLYLCGVHKIGELDFLHDFTALTELSLHWLKTKHLFDFSKLLKLNHLYLYRMLHLKTISQLETAKALKILTIVELPKLKIPEIGVIAKMPNLEKLNITYINENPNSYMQYVHEIGFGKLLGD